MANEKRLIDANFALERIETNYILGVQTKEWMRSYIKTCPTVDAVEVVHGRWKIEWECERDYVTGECEETPVATCPFCEHKEYGFAYDDYWGKPHNYCPNCGAKMDGGKDDD